jgi:hypothetical protein
MGPWPNEEEQMADVGDGGWISGSMSNVREPVDRNRERRAKFLADHPEWSIVFIRSMDRYEASKGNTDTALVILHDKTLGQLVDRLEAEYGKPGQDEDR